MYCLHTMATKKNNNNRKKSFLNPIQDLHFSELLTKRSILQTKSISICARKANQHKKSNEEQQSTKDDNQTRD